MPIGKSSGVQGLAKHERTALDELYRTLRGEVARFVRRRFGSGPPEPEEVMQAAFERLARAQQADTRIDNPRSYLLTVASNIVRDYHRQATVRANVCLEVGLRDRDLEVSELTPERVLIDRQRLDILKVALARMPEMRRRVFLFIRVEGMSVAEVAKQFGVSETTVYKHVSRAMQDCVAAFEAADRDHDDGDRG